MSAPQSVGQLADEPILVQELPLRKTLASALIGIGGETVARIRRESRCKIHVRKTPPEIENQIVELRGTPMEVDTAIGLIKDLCAELEPSYVMEVPSHTASYVPITPDMVGCVIGKSGMNVKQIRTTTGAAVRVEELEPGNETQFVSIKGTVAQVRHGYSMVRELLDKFDPSKVRHRAPTGYEQGYPNEQGYMNESGHYPGPDMGLIDNSQLDSMRGGQDPQYGNSTYGFQGTVIAAPQQQIATLGGSSGQVILSSNLQGGATPTLVLIPQPDGTYRTAQVITVPGNQTIAQTPQMYNPTQTLTQSSAGQQLSVAANTALDLNSVNAQYGSQNWQLPSGQVAIPTSSVQGQGGYNLAQIATSIAPGTNYYTGTSVLSLPQISTSQLGASQLATSQQMGQHLSQQLLGVPQLGNSQQGMMVTAGAQQQPGVVATNQQGLVSSNQPVPVQRLYSNAGQQLQYQQ